MDNSKSQPSQQNMPTEEGIQDSFKLILTKMPGEQNFACAMDMSSAAAGLNGILIILTKYAQLVKLPLERVLSIIAVALFGPSAQQDQKRQKKDD